MEQKQGNAVWPPMRRALEVLRSLLKRLKWRSNLSFNCTRTTGVKFRPKMCLWRLEKWKLACTVSGDFHNIDCVLWSARVAAKCVKTMEFWEKSFFSIVFFSFIKLHFPQPELSISLDCPQSCFCFWAVLVHVLSVVDRNLCVNDVQRLLQASYSE